MSEHPTGRPDFDALTWAEGPDEYTVTEPTAGKKEAGYDPGPPGEVPSLTLPSKVQTVWRLWWPSPAERH